MCGISGFNFEDKSKITKMCEILQYRGPDSSGQFIDSGISIGMTRLAIIDLQTGNQPQHNEDYSIWIVFNGVIYNYKELKEILQELGHEFYTQSDTEVIIHSYEQWGYEFLQKLRGPFSFCIYDSLKGIFFLARDHLGLKPLYYFFKKGKFIFSSEIKGILLHEVHRKLDINALNLYLSFSYVPSDLTLFENIFKLPPSSYLIFDLKKKEIEIKNYWNLITSINTYKKKEILAAELRSLLENSVKIRLMSDVDLGAYLSGGIDSSSIVALMSKFMDNPVKTFSVKFESEATNNESKYARIIADKFNTEHEELLIKSDCYTIIPEIIWHHDDLIADPASIPIYYLSEFAKEKIKVALIGDGSDEIFAGYSEYNWLSHRKRFLRYIPHVNLNYFLKCCQKIPSFKLQTLLSTFNSFHLEERRFLAPLLYIKDSEKIIKIGDQHEGIDYDVINQGDLITKYSLFDLKYQLPNQYNMKTDKMNMANSIEARTPFLDQELVEWALSIPSDLKLKNNNEKFVLKLAMKEYLPKIILKRKKTGFNTPIDFWLKTGMYEITDLLLDRLSKRSDLFDAYYIEKLKKNKTSSFFSQKIWLFLLFEVWFETFIERDEFMSPASIF